MTLRLNGSSSGYTELDAPAAAGSNTITLPTSNGSAEQFLKNSGTAGELEFSSMVETSTGVGIGTTSPQTKLHSSGTTNGAQATFGGSDSGLKISTFQKTDNDAGVTLDAQQSSNGTLTFATTGTERARLDSSGRFLIGTTSTTNAKTSADDLVIGSLSGDRGMTIVSAITGSGTINFSDGTGGASSKGIIQYDHGNNSMHLYTNEGERIRIESGGRIGLGPNNAGSTVVCSTTQSAGTSYAVLSGTHSASSPVGGTISVRIWNNGNIQNTNNSYGSLSDSKLKENIVDASSQWDDIKDIRVRNYNFIEGETHTQLGVVAQEVETVSPGLVYETPDRDNEGTDLGTVTKSVNYSVLYMKAVKALQEAQTRIETLETKVAALEAAE
jgi:hypothetical protein